MQSDQVYRGGTAEGVRCISCGVGSTSGSWRKGWEVPGGLANLCNRCGQRWQKSGRATSLEAFRAADAERAAERTSPGPGGAAAPRPPPAAAAGGAPVPAKRPLRALGEALLPPATRSRRTLSMTSSEEGEAVDELSPRRSPRFTLPADPRPAQRPQQRGPAAGGRPPLPPARQQQQGPLSGRGKHRAAHPRAAQLEEGEQAEEQLQATEPGPSSSGGGGYATYAVQKLAGQKATHRLYWLQDAAGDSTLAVVGTDARQTGHFVYRAAEGMPPLRCTNGEGVAAWLEASFGVRRQRAEAELQLPELSAAERKRLLSPAEPAWAAPPLPPGPWTGAREESGRLADGRHAKRYWLLGGPGGVQELLAVVGADSARKDRRYKYVATEALNSLALDNSKEVLDYLSFCLGRQPGDPLPVTQTRLAHPIGEEELGSPETRAALALRCGLPHKGAGPSPEPSSSGAGSGGAAPAAGTPPRAAGPPAGVPGPRGTPSGPAAAARGRHLAVAAAGPPPHPPSGGKVRPGGGGEGKGKGRGKSSSGLEPIEVEPAAAGQGEPATEAAAAGADDPTPMELLLPPPRQLRLKCALCGAGEHATEECALSCASPPALVHTGGGGGGGGGKHRTFSSLLLDDPAALASPMAADSPLPWRVGTELRQTEGATYDARPQAAFQAKPELLNWTFKAWERRLSACISDLPPPLPTSELDVPVGGWAWTPTGEALAILQELQARSLWLGLGDSDLGNSGIACGAEVSLQLLHETQITRAVAELRSHRDQQVARLAEAITDKWRGLALAAMQTATSWARAQRAAGAAPPQAAPAPQAAAPQPAV
eukprot:scaffold1.g5279.t1